MRNPSGFRRGLLTAGIMMVLPLAQLSSALANDACTEVDGVLTCEGDQSAGVSVTAPPNTLNLSNLTGPVQPASGTPGIQLQSSGASDLTVNSGTVQANVSIETSEASGIRVTSTGRP